MLRKQDAKRSRPITDARAWETTKSDRSRVKVVAFTTCSAGLWLSLKQRAQMRANSSRTKCIHMCFFVDGKVGTCSLFAHRANDIRSGFGSFEPGHVSIVYDAFWYCSSASCAAVLFLRTGVDHSMNHPPVNHKNMREPIAQASTIKSRSSACSPAHLFHIAPYGLSDHT
jgi:hypothetical protein